MSSPLNFPKIESADDVTRTWTHDLTTARGALFTLVQGIEMPAHFGDPAAEYLALREGAALVDRADRGWLAVRGPDRARWLHGMCTNTVKDLAPGQGIYTFFLNAQGQVQADGWILAEQEQLLIGGEGYSIPALVPMLDHYIIMDDVQMEDVSGQLGTVGVEGPRAAETTAAVLGIPQDLLPSLPGFHGRFGELLVQRIASGFWLAGDPVLLPALWSRLEAAGARPVGVDAWNAVRIEDGTPRLGLDIADTTLVHETTRLDAVHFSKGCYIGQEIVERVRSRGQVNRQLTGFRSGECPPESSRLTIEGRDAGWITSSARSYRDGGWVSLGYARREFQTPGAMLDAGTIKVTVAPLPFARC